MVFLRNIFAFLLMPAVGVSAYTLVKELIYFTASAGERYVPFWIGILSYIAFQVVFYKPMKTYIFGHELSHALAGILSGAKIKKFNVNEKSGNIILTKDNIWITLAPYFFPIYTFTVIILYICLGWFMDIRYFYGYFIFLIGFSIAFHIALTVYVLSIEQPDLKVYGVFLSYIVILSLNVIVFSLLLALVFPGEIDVKSVFLKMADNTIGVYKFIYVEASKIWQAFQKTK
jgi:hypothetical protein